jgi:23S rRNA (uracil1939-C5)-methyltransferase
MPLYREWKAQKVAEAFQSQGLKPRKWFPTRFIGEQKRRRLTFSVRRERGGLCVGFYQRRSQTVFDAQTCLVTDPLVFGVRLPLKKFLEPLLRKGDRLDVFLQRVGKNTEAVFTGELEGGLPRLLKEVGGFAEGAKLARVAWRESDSRPPQVIWGQKPLLAKFGKLSVPLPPAAFLQPTEEGEAALVEGVLGALPEKGRFADLFSGCGTFSGPLLERGSVEAFESLGPSIKALGASAGSLPLKVYQRDLFRNPLRREELNRFDALVFDPPRAGCVEQAHFLAQAKTGTLVGVSCNPATFARDARVLCDGGYWLQSLQIVDQFLWSHHVEVIGVFTKRKSVGTRK